MAVAIWDHAPSGQELVERRRAAGWTPRATDTVDGPVILGLGACPISTPVGNLPGAEPRA